MRFSMLKMFAVLGMVGLSGGAWGDITKYPKGTIEPYGYARDISVNATYFKWECLKAAEIEGTLVETGPNRATCMWKCPVGYCWSDATYCNTKEDELARTIYRTFVVDPSKTDNGEWKIVADGDADEDGQLDYDTGIHKKAYVTWTYGGIMAFTDSLSGSVKGCVPNYAYNYYFCSYDDAKPSVKASTLTEKTSDHGTCTFTCADGYKKDGKATYTVRASAGTDGAQVVIKATPCTGNTIKVDYNENGGSNANNGSCTYGGTLTLPAAPSRTGYTFGGWMLADGKTVKSASTSVTCNSTNLGVYENTSSGKVVAQWTANTYTITLNDNGGSGGSGTVKEVYNTKWTNSSNTTISSVTVPTRGDGYKFTGYFDKASGGNQIIPATGVLPVNTTIKSNTTLYAQWSANVYDITYDCGTGATFGTTGKQTKTYENAATYGAAYEIPLDAYCTHPTKPFGGWNFPN